MGAKHNCSEKQAIFLGVAQDYILINEIDTNDITTCDYYNIKIYKVLLLNHSGKKTLNISFFARCFIVIICYVYIISLF